MKTSPLFLVTYCEHGRMSGMATKTQYIAAPHAIAAATEVAENKIRTGPYLSTEDLLDRIQSVQRVGTVILPNDETEA